MLYITVHAEQRFLERVLNVEVNTENLIRAKEWLSQEFDLDKKYLDGKYTLPSFPDFIAVMYGGTMMTIVPRTNLKRHSIRSS